MLTPGDTTKPLIRVERLTVAEPYAGRRIVYRSAPNELAFWDFRQWACATDRMITASMAGRLSETGLFRGVDSFPYSWDRADLVLGGAVLAFEELDKEDGWYGHVKMFLEVTEQSSREVIWSSKIEVERKAAGRNPEALVQALSEALDEVVSEVERNIEQAVH